MELGPDDRSYIKGTFTGQLIGEKDGKHYAIYNLKKPLFESLRGATVEKLSLKNVSISGKDDIGSLANEATDNTKIKQVHVDGVWLGRGIGGLLAKADQSSITESSFKGRIVNTYETTAAYNIGGLVGHLTGGRASLTKSKATVAISSNTNSSDQTVGGLAGLVDKMRIYRIAMLKVISTMSSTLVELRVWLDICGIEKRMRNSMQED